MRSRGSGYVALHVAIQTYFFCWRNIGDTKHFKHFPQTPMPLSKKKRNIRNTYELENHTFIEKTISLQKTIVISKTYANRICS